MRYVITMIISAIAAWMASPYYLAVAPSVNAMVLKIVAFFIFWAFLSLLVRKTESSSKQ